jgi:hypothetical protein
LEKLSGFDLTANLGKTPIPFPIRGVPSASKGAYAVLTEQVRRDPSGQLFPDIPQGWIAEVVVNFEGFFLKVVQLSVPVVTEDQLVPIGSHHRASQQLAEGDLKIGILFSWGSGDFGFGKSLSEISALDMVGHLDTGQRKKGGVQVEPVDLGAAASARSDPWTHDDQWNHQRALVEGFLEGQAVIAEMVAVI